MGAQFVQVLRDHAAKDQHRTEVNQYMKVGFIEQRLRRPTAKSPFGS